MSNDTEIGHLKMALAGARDRAEAAEKLASSMGTTIRRLLAKANVYNVHHLGEGLKDHCRYCNQAAFNAGAIQHTDTCPITRAESALTMLDELIDGAKA